MKRLESIAAYLCALLFFQTLFFKFTGAAESKWIFTQLGVEPWGRWISGGIELVTGALLIIPRTRVLGALLGAGVMTGALLSHLFVLGVDVQNDGGFLFFLCLVCLASCGLILFNQRERLKLKLSSLMIMTFLLIPIMGNAKVSYNDEGEFGIHGYDPVSYLENQQAQEGNKTIQHKHDGITYLFTSLEHKEKFIKAPEKYIPAYGGWCAYAMADGDKVDIDPKTFKIINGKTYLFYNGLWGNTLTKWNKEESPLKTKADSEWEKLLKK